MSLLDEILKTKKSEIDLAKRRRPIEKLKKMVDENEDVRSLKKSIDHMAHKYGFGIIGEIKKKSPSMNSMKQSNVERALDTYNENETICGISVLTDYEFFGQNL